jgi:hypothetical protein
MNTLRAINSKQQPIYQVLRLRVGDWLAWELFPVLERRIRLYSPEIATDTPVDMLISVLRQAFVADNPLYCIMVLHDEHHNINAHLIAWIEILWGRNYALVHQLKADLDVRKFRSAAWTELYHWITMVNQLGCKPPVMELRWATHRGDAWHRSLKRLCRFERSVLSLDINQIQQLAERK